MTDRSFRDGSPVPLFHQVNIAYWCGLAPGETPGVGSDPDSGQVGSAWLPLDRLDRYDVRPLELARWLLTDPSDRPLGLGVTGVRRERWSAGAGDRRCGCGHVATGARRGG